MGLKLCKKCGWMHFGTDPCRPPKVKPKASSKPKAIKGAKFVAEVPPDTKLTTARGKVIASAPTMPASEVTDEGLKPIVIAHHRVKDLSPEGVKAIAEGIKAKGGRPKIHPDRKAYKAQKERERRARLKAGKP